MNRIPRKKKKKYKKDFEDRLGYKVVFIKSSINKPSEFEPWGLFVRPKYPTTS
jgi:hypothetical protein